MKILIVSQYYYPEQFQINDIAPKLVKRGHEVTVLCGTTRRGCSLRGLMIRRVQK